MGIVDAITPTDTERAAMWPENLVQRLDWILHEVGELEVVDQQTEERKAAVSQRADELEAVVVQTRSELTARDVGLTKTSGYLDRLGDLVATFRSRIGLGEKPGESSDGDTSEESGGGPEEEPSLEGGPDTAEKDEEGS